jgi:hypothetical protein
VPAATVGQAIAIMESLKHKRRETGLEAHRRRCPRFTDYVDTYLAAVEHTKKPHVMECERSMLGLWKQDLGDLGIDQVRKVTPKSGHEVTEISCDCKVPEKV